jgi:YspA, cpYpsA-related SLOG family
MHEASRQVRILVCGDRNWKDGSLIGRTIDNLRASVQINSIVEGGAPGADKLARQHAIKVGIFVIEVLPDWRTYGKAAGNIRNQKMLDDYRPDMVLAFHDDIGNSKGTADMMDRAEKAGIEVKLFSHIH